MFTADILGAIKCIKVLLLVFLNTEKIFEKNFKYIISILKNTDCSALPTALFS